VTIIAEPDRARARYHTGYGGVQAAATFFLGVPAAVQTSFVIETALNNLLPSALPRFLSLLDNLDALDQQIMDDADTLVVTKVDEIDLNEKEFEKIIQRYRHYQGALCNMLLIPPNPFDQRPHLSGGYNGSSTINVSVSG
jgi:hypothetical protein